MQQKKDELGKGIRSLLQNINTELKTTEGKLKTDVIEQSTSVNQLSLDSIEINPGQPRKDFDESALADLAHSIRLHGIIQPITVMATGGGKYKLISGERRFRAARIAGLKEIPAYVRQLQDSTILELALLENLQRQDLNAIEIGLSYQRLMEDLSYSEEKLGERMGMDRTTVTNYVRLLKLPPAIQVAVRNKLISMGHARSLINLDHVDKQLFVFKEIQTKHLSVRQTEDLVRRMKGEQQKTTSTSKTTQSDTYRKIQDAISSKYGTKVLMNHHKKGHGTIRFEYYSLDELNGLLDKLQVTIG
ncbi:MAG: ParB/RepB/Spo0J family partition protein [Ferruginibacter sp.]